MDTIGRRELLSLLAAFGGAASVAGMPSVVVGQSRRNDMTITIGNRLIEIIIPFFPEMPPRGQTIEVALRVNQRDGGRRYRYRMSSAQVMQIAQGMSENRVVVSSGAGRSAVRGEFTGRANGTIDGTMAGLRAGAGAGNTEVQAMAGPAVVAVVGIAAGAMVAMVGIVAVVATVKIIAESGGGSVSVSAETAGGDVDVEVQVGESEG